MRKQWKWILIVVLVIVIAFLVYLFYPDESEKTPQEKIEGIITPSVSEELPYDLRIDAKMGTVTIRYDYDYDNRVKVLVLKEGDDVTYQYEMSGTHTITIPLTRGNGGYTVTLYKQKEGTTYTPIKSWTGALETDDLSVFLSSNVQINWANNFAVKNLAKELSAKLESDDEKVRAIRSYIMENYKYSALKANAIGDSVLSVYVDLNEVYAHPDYLICTDFAVLNAAMLRSIGIPTTLVKGYSDKANGYHAWNEVYVDGEWRIMDVSYDAQLANDEVYKDELSYNDIRLRY